MISCSLAFQFGIAQATGIAPAQNIPSGFIPEVDIVGNGVPIIAITAPDNSGVSHNKYVDFNVRTEGVILNNSNQDLQRSQLGGLIGKNPNLEFQSPAKYILNEVISSNRSTLLGAIEVHGKQAEVIIANPNGITCDGCSFVNTPRVTLSTGTPQINAFYYFSGFRVENGAITIGENGASLPDVSVFDLVSRRIIIDGPIKTTGDINLVVGRNSYAYQSGAITPLPSNNQLQPDVAIDSSLLGGMYANRIKIISTESGAGINLLGNLFANAHELTIDASGNLVVASAQAKETISLTSTDSITVEKVVYATGDITVNAEGSFSLAEKALLASLNTIDVTSVDVALLPQSLIASGLHQNGSQINAGGITINTNQYSSTNSLISAGASLSISADSIGFTITDNSYSEVLRSLGAITFTTNSVDDNGAIINLNGNFEFKSSSSLTFDGVYNVGGSFDVSATYITTNSGAEFNVVSSATITSTVGGITNNGSITGNHNISLVSETTITNNNILQSVGAISLDSEGGLTNSVNGEIVSNSNLEIKADSFENDGAIDSQSLTVTVATTLKNMATGYISGNDSLNITATSITNYGDMGSAYGSVLVMLTGDLSNYGLLYSGGLSQYFLDGTLTNNAKAHIFSGTSLYANATEIANKSGTIESNSSAVENGIFLSAETIKNEGVATDVSKASSILSEGVVVIDADVFANTYSQLTAYSTIQIAAVTSIENKGSSDSPASIESGGTISLSAPSINNDATHYTQTENDTISSTASNLSAIVTIDPNLPLDPLKQLTISINNLINQSILFEVETEPNSPFLIETRSQFITLSSFVSSHYFTTQLGSSGVELTTRRLGDAYVESKIILAQVYNLTGQRLLSGFRDSHSLITQLYDNALAAKDSLQLTAGVALTPQQINSLTEDILWLEEQIVNGEVVLVPRLYLAPSNRSFQVTSASIKANNIFVKFTNENKPATLTNTGMISAATDIVVRLSGDVINTGTLQSGENSYYFLEGDFTNTEADVSAGGNIAIAGTTITNSSGSIIADGDLALHGNAIINKRTVFDVENTTPTSVTTKDNPDDPRSSTTTVVSTREVLTETTTAASKISAGKTLTITAGSLLNAYSSISSGGAMSISAIDMRNNGRDLTQTKNITKTIWQKQNFCSQSILGECIKRKDRWVKRVDDQSTESSIYDTDSAAATIASGGNLDIYELALDENKANDFDSTVINSGTLSSGGILTIANFTKLENNHGTVETTETTETTTVANDKPQYDIRIIVDQFNNLSGLVSGNDVGINATTITSETSAQRYSFDDGDVFTDQVLKIATITARNNLTIAASDTITLIGSNSHAGELASLSAQNSIDIGALELQSYFSDTFKGGAYVQHATNNLLSNIRAGTTDIDSKGDITITGATISSENNTFITATKSVAISSAQDTFTSISTFTYESNNDLFGTTLNASQQVNRQTTKATTISAGGSIFIASREGDVSITATNLASGDNINLSAEEGKIALLSNIDENSIKNDYFDRDLLWQKNGGSTVTSKTRNYVEMSMGGELFVNAKSVTVDRKVAQSVVISGTNVIRLDEIGEESLPPELAWMNSLQNDPTVSWNEVGDTYRKSSFKNQGLTPEGQMVVAIAIAAATSGTSLAATSATLGATTTTTAAGVATTIATTSSTLAAAAIGSAITQASISLINSQGDLDTTYEDLTSKEFAKSLLTSISISGLSSVVAEASGLNQALADNASWVDVLEKEAKTIFINSSLEAGVTTIVNEGGRRDLEDNFKLSLRNNLSTSIAKTISGAIADAAKKNEINNAELLASHTALGCLTGSLSTDGDCASGASDALLEEATKLIKASLTEWVEEHKKKKDTSDKLDDTGEKVAKTKIDDAEDTAKNKLNKYKKTQNEFLIKTIASFTENIVIDNDEDAFKEYLGSSLRNGIAERIGESIGDAIENEKDTFKAKLADEIKASLTKWANERVTNSDSGDLTNVAKDTVTELIDDITVSTTAYLGLKNLENDFAIFKEEYESKLQSSINRIELAEDDLRPQSLLLWNSYKY